MFVATTNFVYFIGIFSNFVAWCIFSFVVLTKTFNVKYVEIHIMIIIGHESIKRRIQAR